MLQSIPKQLTNCALQVILVIWLSGVLSYEPVTKPVFVPGYVPPTSPALRLVPKPLESYELTQAKPPYRKYKYLSYQAYCDTKEAPDCQLDPSGTYCLDDPSYPYDDVRVSQFTGFSFIRP